MNRFGTAQFTQTRMLFLNRQYLSKEDSIFEVQCICCWRFSKGVLLWIAAQHFSRLKKNKKISTYIPQWRFMFSTKYYFWIYFWWSLCTSYLLVCHNYESYRRWFRLNKIRKKTLMLMWDIFRTLLYVCWFFHKEKWYFSFVKTCKRSENYTKPYTTTVDSYNFLI